MLKLIIDTIVIFLSVFAGLFVLWSVVRLMTPKQRLIYAAFAGGVSAILTAIITGTVMLAA